MAPITDPITALEELAGQAKALVDSLAAVVTDLKTIRYRGDHGEQLRGELTVYLAALQQAESILGRIVVLDLDDRRVRVDERRARLEAEVTQAAVANMQQLLLDLGLDLNAPEVQQAVRAFFCRWDGAPVPVEAEVVELKELIEG